MLRQRETPLPPTPQPLNFVIIEFISNMEFRQLVYFIAVAEELHFGKAAEKLHLSQPALSKQIHALENSLEIKLFERTRHWVRLTPAGQKFLITARCTLQQLEQGIKVAQQVARGEIGRLKIGFPNPTLLTILPTVLEKYRRLYPQVELTLVGGGTETQVEALRTHQIDLGFVYLPIREDTLAVELLYEETFLVALPTSHPLAKRKKISLKSLADEPLILYPRSLAPILYNEFLDCCQQAGFSPNIVQEGEMTDTRLGLVAGGVGVAFIIAGLQNLRLKGVVYRALKDDFPKLKLALAWRKGESSPMVHKFRQLTKAITL
jgi:DNA-binding transcriptional LysR family regulator